MWELYSGISLISLVWLARTLPSIVQRSGSSPLSSVASLPGVKNTTVICPGRRDVEAGIDDLVNDKNGREAGRREGAEGRKKMTS